MSTTTYTIAASDKTRAAIESAKARFRDLDRSAKNLSTGLGGIGKAIGVGGAVTLAFKVFQDAVRRGEEALKAASEHSKEFAAQLAAVEKAAKDAAAPANLPELSKQLDSLKGKLESDDYRAAMGAWSQYWADRAIFVKDELADIVRVLGKIGRMTGAIDDVPSRAGAVLMSNRRGSRALAGRVSSEAANTAIEEKAQQDALKRAKEAQDAFNKYLDDFAAGLARKKELADESARTVLAMQPIDGQGLESGRFDQFGEQLQESLNAVAEGIEARVITVKDATDEMSVYAEQAARNMQDAFADFLFDPFDRGVKGMLSDFLNVVRRMVAEAAAANLFTAFGGAGGVLGSALGGLFGGARAEGGPVSAGRSYLVGERGPEWFTPGRSGAITPNAGGGVTINQTVDARGATADAIALLPSAMKAASDDAVRRVLTMQKQGRI